MIEPGDQQPSVLLQASIEPTASESVNESWQQWIATNLMQGMPAEQLLQVLIANGFSAALSQREIALTQNHPYILAGRSINEKLKKRDWVLNSLSILKDMSPYAGQIDRRYKLSRAEFFENYYFMNRPVMIQGMLNDWPALECWTPEYFKRKCGKQLIEVQFGRNENLNYEIKADQYIQQMKFSDYIDLIQSSTETNDFYITARNTNTNGEALSALWQDVPLMAEYLKTDSITYPGFFWYGPKGTITPLHHDLTNNFMAQVQGRKLVRLFSPTHLPNVYNNYNVYSPVDLGNIDYAQFPQFKNIKIMDVIIEPGDLLFLPVGYWHYVLGLETSITMTYTNFLHSNDFCSFYTTPGDI